MTINYRKAQFLISAEKLEQCPEDVGYEVAFAGRSNAGKSSAINVLTDNKKLARTSKTPGRTQLINMFSLDSERRIVDLPGYGYAKVSEKMKLRWQKHLNEYLQERNCLRGLILLMDIRHPFQDFDEMVIQWATASELPLHILLTKSDKLKPNEARNQLFKTQKILDGYGNTFTIQQFSAHTKKGLVELQTILNTWYAEDTNTTENIESTEKLNSPL